MRTRIVPDADGAARFLRRTVVAVRWLLGVQCLLSGLNWWFKILPFPNMFDPPGMPMKSEIVRTMIDSGWMFTFAKAVEVALGLSLLCNRLVPLMLVVSMPIILMTFLADALILGTVTAWLHGEVGVNIVAAKVFDLVYFGGAVLIMQIFLIFSYFEHYRSMLSFRPTARVEW